MILTKEVEVKPTGKMTEYYKSLGYHAKSAKPLIVKVEDLPRSSNIRVFVLCDYCGLERSPRYTDYYNSVNTVTNYNNKL